MRTLFMVLVASLLLASGCSVAVRDGGHGHYASSHRGDSHRHNRHRSHHHWNAAGPAYAEASTMATLVILSVNLPEEIHGVFTPADELVWRRDWPARASTLIADGLTKTTGGAVTGSTGSSKPESGHYMTLTITYLDVGDVRRNDDGTPRARGSALMAHGLIVNAVTGATVADVKFTESSGWTGQWQFETFMSGVGSSLGDWFKEKRTK